jgi:hypothetical protein
LPIAGREVQLNKVGSGCQLIGFNRSLEARIDLHEVWRPIGSYYEVEAITAHEAQVGRHFLGHTRQSSADLRLGLQRNDISTICFGAPSPEACEPDELLIHRNREGALSGS